ILADTVGDLTITEVTEQLRERGDATAEDATVGATLSREAKAGRLVRVAEGRYAHPTTQRTLQPNAA
ncbi:MAG: hypothetical protein HOV68_08775, partial [Streptomycetaceae bacterium]|nr:hypothetical protein [Streptomycetaceae bacterium]